MSNGKKFGSSHAPGSPPKKQSDGVRTTPGDPLRDEIRKTPKRLEDPPEKTPKRVEDPPEPEPHGGSDPDHGDEEPQRRPLKKAKEVF
jgi:hypothetical protein